MWTIYQKRVQSFLDTTPFTQSLLNWHRCTVECQGYIVNIPFVAKSRLGKVWGATPCKRANTHSCEPCTYLHFIISLYKCPMQTHLITHSYSNHITSLQVECTSFWDKKWTRNTKRRRDPREPYLLVVNLWKDVKWTIVPYEPFKWSKWTNLCSSWTLVCREPRYDPPWTKLDPYVQFYPTLLRWGENSRIPFLFLSRYY